MNYSAYLFVFIISVVTIAFGNTSSSENMSPMGKSELRSILTESKSELGSTSTESKSELGGTSTESKSELGSSEKKPCECCGPDGEPCECE
ncbi:hypothetical protein P3W45_000496 [Vairimorpha bombi]|jgi:hypothetical protein